MADDRAGRSGHARRTTPDAATATLVLPAASTSPRRAREFVASVLTDWGQDELLTEAQLLTSELVTNAVLHAGTDLTISVTADRDRATLIVAVRDGSDSLPRVRHYSPLATTGRGLAIVGQSAVAFGAEPIDSGKEVWFELPMAFGPTDRTDRR